MWNGTWIVVDSPLPRYTAAKSKSSLKRSLRRSQVPKSFSLSLSLYSRAYPTIEHVSSVLQRGNQPCKINRFETLGPDAGEEVPRMWLHPFNFFKWNCREENSQIGSRWMGNRRVAVSQFFRGNWMFHGGERDRGRRIEKDLFLLPLVSSNLLLLLLHSPSQRLRSTSNRGEWKRRKQRSNLRKCIFHSSLSNE